MSVAEYMEHTMNNTALLLSKALLELRGKEKLLSTYYDKTLECLNPRTGCVHPNFIQVGTDTGRLGCRAINAQNQPRTGKVKDHFTSRFYVQDTIMECPDCYEDGEKVSPNGDYTGKKCITCDGVGVLPTYKQDGHIVNLDLKQIEVAVFSQLCKDKTLIGLLNQGVDLHTYTASDVTGKDEKDVTKEERQDAKAGNFGIIYGNGAGKLSSTTGRSVEWCRDYINRFYEMFPGAKIWHDNIQQEVEDSGQLKLFTGEILKFEKRPAKFDWQIRQGIRESYNPPDIKNHPVQHIAAVISFIMIGSFFREYAIHKRDKYLMINTVHDSLMLDCRAEYVEEAEKDLQECVDRLPEKIYTLFNEKFSVPIRCDIEHGQSWGDL